MFASLHSAFSSAGSKYGANGPSSKQSYTTTATLPARFSVHVAPQKALGFAASPYYPQSANVINKSDRDGAVGYRPSIPQAQYPGPPRYDDRYAHAHPAPPRLNTSAPAAIPRGYADPKLSAPAPAPVSIPAPPRNGVPNFNIYQGSAQDTYIYEQSQGSKSDLLSTSEFDSVVSPSPTESMSSTVTMRGGADTPRTDAGSLEPSPVEPPTPMSRRNSLVFNGGPPPPMEMGMHGSYTGRSAGRAPPPVGRMGAFPPHMAAAMNRTPSMDSVDVRERIAIANAEYNSASTGSYYSSPEPSTKSHTPSPPQHASHPIPPMTPGSSSSQRLTQQQQPQAVYSEPAYIHTSPEAAHAHIQGPSGTRSRSISPPQPQPLPQQQQGAYPDTRPSSRHEIRRPSPPQQQSSGYGSGASTPQMRRSPSQRGDYNLPPSSNSPPTYPQADDYFTQNASSSSRHAPQQPQAYGPDTGYANMKYSTTPSSSPPREDPYAQDRRDRSSSTSPPAINRQTSTRYSSGAGHQERDRYSHSPPDTSVRLDDDGYSRERDVPRRERKVSYSSSMGRPIPDTPVSYSSSSGSSSSNSTARGERDRDRDRERDYAPRDRDSRDRDRERERDRDRDYYSSSSSRDRDRDRDSRRNSVYPAEALQQQQSTVPFHKSTPPSPPNQNQNLKYPVPPSAPLPPLPNGPQRQGSYPPPAAPERMTRQRSVSMSSAPHAPSRLSTVEDVSMSMSNMSLGPEETSFNGGRGPRHPDLGTPSSNAVPMPSTGLEADPVGAPVYRRRRMSVISQISDAGSMATTATGVSNVATIASSALPPPPSASMPPREYAPESRSHRSASDPPAPIPAAIPPSQQQQAYRPEQQPAPYRRMSDGDRPASRYDLKVNTEYAVEYGKQYTPHPEPVRRYSDGETSATLPSVGFRSQGQQQQQQQYQQQYGQYQQGGLMGGRNVRWNDNLICPSPVLPSAKRQGWYNRRGDQLWTNDGMFRPAPADQQYPPDLDDYPDHGEGWQNEDGVRIDMEHRRIPKVPRRSALKVPGGVSSSAGGGVSFA